MAAPPLYIPQLGSRSALNAWLAAADGPNRAELYVSNTPYTRLRVLTDYTLASFPGYAPVSPVVWGVTFINGASKAEADSPALHFHYSGLVGTVVVFGLLLSDVGGLNLRAVLPFISPIILTPVSPDLDLIVQLTATSEL